MSKKRKAVKRPASKAARRSRAGARRAAAPRSPRHALAVATNTRGAVKERVAAMAEVPTAVCQDDENLQSVLTVLRDRSEPIAVRLAALQSLQAASFSVVAFEACRGDYIAALREVSDDADPELRQRVLGILAREKDRPTQKKLLDGLRNPSKALLPPEKALQLLGNDVHAEAYAAAREIVRNPPNPLAKREALRLLAADAKSTPMFEKILRDKDETPEIRQLSASALNALHPDRLQTVARDLLLDRSDNDEIHATSLTALTQFGDAGAVARDAALRRRVDSLSTGTSTKLKAGARQFMTKYGK